MAPSQRGSARHGPALSPVPEAVGQTSGGVESSNTGAATGPANGLGARVRAESRGDACPAVVEIHRESTTRRLFPTASTTPSSGRSARDQAARARAALPARGRADGRPCETSPPSRRPSPRSRGRPPASSVTAAGAARERVPQCDRWLGIKPTILKALRRRQLDPLVSVARLHAMYALAARRASDRSRCSNRVRLLRRRARPPRQRRRDRAGSAARC